MKTKHLTLLAFFSLFIAFFSFCKKTESEPNYPINIPFDEYSLEGTQCQWTNLPYNDEVIVINNKEELEKYVSCSENNFPAIDFSKHTLLLARGKNSSGVLELNIKDLQQHSSNKYSLEIEITLSDTVNCKSWCKALIVKKMNEDSKVKLNATFKKQDIVYPYDVPFVEYSLEGTGCKWNTPQSLCVSCVKKINSNEELYKYLRCTDGGSYPDVDFSKYTLILAYGRVTGSSFELTFKGLQMSSEQNYLMKFTISCNPLSQQMNYWSFPVLVNKDVDNYPIQLIVNHI